MPLNAPAPVRNSGHYGYAPVGAIIDTDPAPLWGDVNGVPMGMQYFYGSVRSAARDLDVEVELDGEPFDETTFPIKVTYTGGGQTWIWETNEGGRCPIRHDLERRHRRRQGWVHQAGETRNPMVTEALMETYNGRLIETGALKNTAPV